MNKVYCGDCISFVDKARCKNIKCKPVIDTPEKREYNWGNHLRYNVDNKCKHYEFGKVKAVIKKWWKPCHKI